MIKCYVDSNGNCRVEPNDVHPLIGAYLEQDIQGCLATCQEMTTIIDEIAGGKRGRWSGTGNDHTVIVQPGEVSILNEFDDSLGNATMSLDVFRNCIAVWKECILSRQCKDANLRINGA